MAAPQDGYQGQGYPSQDPYAQQGPVQPGFTTTSPPPPPVGHPEHEAGKKKRRGYAAQAYDFGTGPNSALGGQTQGGAQFQPVQAPAYGGYPQQQEPQPVYGGAQYGIQPGVPSPEVSTTGYGVQPQFAAAGSYQPPDAGYPGPGAPAAGSVGGVTQGMGQMNVGGPGASPAAQSQQVAARPAVLNQLFPTDLLNTPFNVAELELPPPPIILPLNVSYLAVRN